MIKKQKINQIIYKSINNNKNNKINNFYHIFNGMVNIIW